MAVNDIWVVENHFTYQGNPNVYCDYFRVDSESDAEQVGPELNTHMDGVITSLLVPLHSANLTFDCLQARQVFPTKGLPNLFITNDSGSRSGTEDLPGQCSLVNTLYGDIANPTKNNRGRDFLTGQLEADQNAGVWATAYILEVRTYYNGRAPTFTGASGNSYSWGVFSASEAAKPGPPTHFWGIDLVRIRHLVRTQRRRQAQAACELYTEATPAAP